MKWTGQNKSNRSSLQDEREKERKREIKNCTFRLFPFHRRIRKCIAAQLTSWGEIKKGVANSKGRKKETRQKQDKRTGRACGAYAFSCVALLLPARAMGNGDNRGKRIEICVIPGNSFPLRTSFYSKLFMVCVCTCTLETIRGRGYEHMNKCIWHLSLKLSLDFLLATISFCT